MMKRIFITLILIVVLFSLPRLAQAAFFWEEFSGVHRQYIGEGSAFLFGFDFRYLDGDRPGAPLANKDTSPALSLTHDVSGIFLDYEKARLDIILSSNDVAVERAGVNLWLLSGGIHNIDLGTFWFSRNNNNIYHFEHILTPDELDWFDDTGRCVVQIEAALTPANNYNDFYINRVRMSVCPVPEPSSMALLGLGLLGLARKLRRK